LGIHCYYERNEKYLGMILHTGIHIFGNIGNIVLYSGNIK
jgi:hypothetical protein